MIGVVFLSHASADKPFVRRLDQTLRALGVKTFLDEREIAVGEDIPARIYQGLSDSTHVCYVISGNSVRSKWVADELSTAKMLEKTDRGLKILPILIDDVEIPTSVMRLKYADFRDFRRDSSLVDHGAFRDLASALGISDSDVRAAATWSGFADTIFLLRAGTEVAQVIEMFASDLETLHSKYLEYESHLPKDAFPSSPIRSLIDDMSGVHRYSSHAWAEMEGLGKVFRMRVEDLVTNLRLSDIRAKCVEYRTLSSQLLQRDPPSNIRKEIEQTYAGIEIVVRTLSELSTRLNLSIPSSFAGLNAGIAICRRSLRAFRSLDVALLAMLGDTGREWKVAEPPVAGDAQKSARP